MTVAFYENKREDLQNCSETTHAVRYENGTINEKKEGTIEVEKFKVLRFFCGSDENGENQKRLR